MDTQLSEIRLTKEQAEEQLEIFRRIYSKVRLLSAEELKEENTTQAGKGENYWKVMPWRREILRRLCLRSCVERENTEDKAEIYRHRTI